MAIASPDTLSGSLALDWTRRAEANCSILLTFWHDFQEVRQISARKTLPLHDAQRGIAGAWLIAVALAHALNSPLKSVSAGIVSIWYWRAAIHKLSPIAQTLLLNVAIVGVTLCASVRGNRVTLRMGRKR